MKIITKEGLKYFQSKYPVNKVWGDEKSFRMRFTVEKENLDSVLNAMREKSIDYELRSGILELTQEHLVKLIPVEYFTEKRVWFGADKMYFCSEMEHSHLSNIVGYLDLLMQLNRISQEKAKNYIKKLETNIIPELEERFDGEILPYKAIFDWDKKMVKELKELKLKQNNL